MDAWRRSSEAGGEPAAQGDGIADLLVVGAGPAGAALATVVARRGYRVVLCEQHALARERLCGEFLSPEALPLLAGLGVLERLRALEPPAIEAVRLTLAGAPEVTHALRPPGLGLGRRALDGALVAAGVAAGVEVRERWRAVGVRAGDGGVHRVEGIARSGAREAIAACVVAGAGGRAGRLLGGGVGRGHEHAAGAARGRAAAAARDGGYLAWKAHHQGAPPAGAIELHFFDGGYCGVTGIEGGRANVCGIATGAAFRRAGGSIDALLELGAAQNRALAARLAGLERAGEGWLSVAGIRFGRRQPCGGGLLRLGDAAGLIAPLAGDGVAMALASSNLAAIWVARRLAGEIDDAGMLRGYARAWRRAFGWRLRIGGLLQRLALDGRAARPVLRACHAMPWLTERMWRGTRGPAGDQGGRAGGGGSLLAAAGR